MPEASLRLARLAEPGCRAACLRRAQAAGEFVHSSLRGSVASAARSDDACMSASVASGIWRHRHRLRTQTLSPPSALSPWRTSPLTRRSRRRGRRAPSSGSRRCAAFPSSRAAGSPRTSTSTPASRGSGPTATGPARRPSVPAAKAPAASRSSLLRTVAHPSGRIICTLLRAAARSWREPWGTRGGRPGNHDRRPSSRSAGPAAFGRRGFHRR